MNTQISLFIISVFIGLLIISNIIETNAFDEVYPVSYPGICKQRLRINTLCDKLENDINKHEITSSALVSPPNMSNDISKKMDGYLHNDYEHHHHNHHNHHHEHIDEEPHPDDVAMENEDDDYKSKNSYISRFAHGLLLFTILSVYCIYMSSPKNERKYDGRILPVYN